MYDLKMMRRKAEEVLDIASLKEQNIDLLNEIMNQLLSKLDLCTGIPMIRIFSTIHKVGKSFFDYLMIIRLMNFYIGCKDVDENRKKKFLDRNVYGKEEKVGYNVLQLLARLDSDEKAILIGKLYVYCVDNEYDIDSYFRICRIVEKCYFDDLVFLSHWKDHETICSQNKLIPQEIMESLFNGGLLAECGFNGGGFKEDDDAGTIYALNRYGNILSQII